MILTTTPDIEGRRILEYRGLVTGQAIFGANIFRDFFAGIRDIVPARVARMFLPARPAGRVARMFLPARPAGRVARMFLPARPAGRVARMFLPARPAGARGNISASGTAVKLG